MPASPLATDRSTTVAGAPADLIAADAPVNGGRSGEPPGTLLWIGPTRHPEFQSAFRFCRDRVAQIAVRASLRSALRRPAGHVRRVIFALPDRSLPRADFWAEFLATQLTAACEVLAIGGSLCDGRGRSGEPWPGGPMLRFSRWEEVLPRWLAPCGVRPSVVAPPRGLLVLCDRFETAEPWLADAQRQGIAVAWNRHFVPVLHTGFERVLWDDSVAPPASAEAWRLRRCVEEAAPHSPLSRQDLWLALQPTSEDIRQALAGGIARVLTKPVTIDSICDAPDPGVICSA